MNRVFKTKWSVAHQEYVVTDEKHTTKTKAAKSAVALAVAALIIAMGLEPRLDPVVRALARRCTGQRKEQTNPERS